MDPFDIAYGLLKLASEIETNELIVSDLPVSKDMQEALSREFRVANRYASPAQEMIGKLQEALDNAEWGPAVSEIPHTERDQWTFGTAFTILGAPKPILHGFVQPVQREPVLRQVPDRVAFYLITIMDGEDYLDRETHGMGKHYHYLNWRKERSNVILSWDTRWKEPATQTKPPTRRALFVEPHGEKKNAKFVARPDLWGVNKRTSMYEACVPDLAKWPIAEFKCAANKSEAVHPPGRTLTPHPNAIKAALAKTAASSKKQNKRKS